MVPKIPSGYPFPSRLPPPPALPIPGLAAALEEVGTVEVTVLDEQLRVVRGVAGARADVLRVFIRDDAGGGVGIDVDDDVDEDV